MREWLQRSVRLARETARLPTRRRKDRSPLPGRQFGSDTPTANPIPPDGEEPVEVPGVQLVRRNVMGAAWHRIMSVAPSGLVTTHCGKVMRSESAGKGLSYSDDLADYGLCRQCRPSVLRLHSTRNTSA